MQRGRAVQPRRARGGEARRCILDGVDGAGRGALAEGVLHEARRERAAARTRDVGNGRASPSILRNRTRLGGAWYGAVCAFTGTTSSTSRATRQPRRVRRRPCRGEKRRSRSWTTGSRCGGGGASSPHPEADAARRGLVRVVVCLGMQDVLDQLVFGKFRYGHDT